MAPPDPQHKDERRRALESEMVNAGKNDHRESAEDAEIAQTKELQQIATAALAAVDAAHGKSARKTTGARSSKG